MNHTRRGRRSNFATAALIGGWIALVVAGVHQLNRHMATASTVPSEGDLESVPMERLAPGTPLRLVMLVHPALPLHEGRAG